MNDKEPNSKAANIHEKIKRSKCSACGLLIKKGERAKQLDGHWFHADTCLVALQSGKTITSRSGRRAPSISKSGGCGPACPHCGGKVFKTVKILTMLFGSPDES